MNPSYFKKDDDYSTPKRAWNDILQFIPKDKIIWDPFFNEGACAIFFDDLERKLIHHNENFFEIKKKNFDIILTNPPYSLKKESLSHIFDFEKPFAVLIPLASITTIYFQKLFQGKYFKIIIPLKRYSFIKAGIQTKHSCFDTVWICYNLNEYLPENQVIYLSI